MNPKKWSRKKNTRSVTIDQQIIMKKSSKQFLWSEITKLGAARCSRRFSMKDFNDDDKLNHFIIIYKDVPKLTL